MGTRSFIMGIAFALLLAGTAGSVEARGKSFHAQFVGTLTDKTDFTFPGGTPGAVEITVAGKSTLGAYTAQAMSDFEPDSKTCTPPGGGSGAELAGIGEIIVLSFIATGEQLFLNLSPGQVGCCSDTGVCTGQITFAINGGTGRFAKATGTIVKTIKVIPLTDFPPPSFFGSFTGAFDGTITLPKGGEDGQSSE